MGGGVDVLKGAQGDSLRRATRPPWATENPSKFHQKINLDFHRFFHQFWVPFGLQFAPKFNPKSKIIPLKIAFGKTTEKYTFSIRKSTLLKSKNVAKRWEGCSKSHFSHIRNEVEKVTLGPSILERFLDPKSTQDREKVFSKSLQKSSLFFISFF